MPPSIRVAVVVLAACAPAPRTKPPYSASSTVALPIRMIEDRFFLETTTKAGAPISLYLDSAGGMFLTKAAAARLQLAIRKVSDPDEGDMEVVTFPELSDVRIPRPAVPDIPLLDPDSGDEGDGMLGAPWFAGHAVTFDYPKRQLLLHADGVLPDVPAEHRIAMALQRDASGKAVSPYGRIQMQVAGETIDMLFDTGATVDLLPEAQQVLGPGPAQRATSFITESVFARWRAGHPEWRVLASADKTAKGAPMIEVPLVTVGGYEVGPVWFTWRPDKAFHEWMAQWMDKPTEGALGGSALRYFRVGADWVHGVVTFAK
jgi:hypothetical protein